MDGRFLGEMTELHEKNADFPENCTKKMQNSSKSARIWCDFADFAEKQMIMEQLFEYFHRKLSETPVSLVRYKYPEISWGSHALGHIAGKCKIYAWKSGGSFLRFDFRCTTDFTFPRAGWKPNGARSTKFADESGEAKLSR